MPLGLSRGDRRLLTVAGAVLLVIILIALVMMRGIGNDADVPLTTSVASGGAKAASLLLEASGYDVTRWQHPPADLTEPERTTLILADPRDMPTKAERQAIESFIAQGGRVIATGLTGSHFLSNGASSDAVGRLAWTVMHAVSPSAVTRAAPAIIMAPQGRWRSEGLFLPLYGDDKDGVVVVRIRVGTGDAYWWAAATPLTNAGLKEPGNLEFFLAQVGEPGARRVLFDEYFHGARPSLAGSVMSSPVKWILVQGGIVLFALLVTFSRRSGPIILPVIDSRLSPLEFVRTLGSLYARAGAAGVAVDVAYRRFRFWLGRRLGMSSTAPIDTVTQAVASRWPIDTAALASTLRQCEAAREDGALAPATALALVRDLGDRAAELKIFPGITVGAAGSTIGAAGLQAGGTTADLKVRRSESTKETR